MTSGDILQPGFERPTVKEVIGVLAFLLATWFAFLVLALGVGSLLLNSDIIVDDRAGVGLGPAMFLGALVGLATALVSAGLSRRRRGRTRAPYVGASVIGTVAALAGYLLVALIGWLAFVTESALSSLLFVVEAAIGWPAVVLVVISFIVSLGYFATLAWRTRDASS